MAGLSRFLWIGTAIQLIFSTVDAVPPVVFAPSQNWYVACWSYDFASLSPWKFTRSRAKEKKPQS
jgi:hypothetical protein